MANPYSTDVSLAFLNVFNKSQSATSTHAIFNRQIFKCFWRELSELCFITLFISMPNWSLGLLSNSFINSRSYSSNVKREMLQMVVFANHYKDVLSMNLVGVGVISSGA